MIVEILIAGHLRRDIARRRPRCRLLAPLARQAGIVEGGRLRLGDPVVDMVGAGEHGFLAARQRDGRIRTGDLRRTFEHGDARRLAVIAGGDAIGAWTCQADRAARRRYVVAVAVVEAGDANIDHALRHGGFEVLVVERGDVELGRAVEMDGGRAEIDLGPRVRLRPERVAGGHRVVERRRRPLLVAAVMERDGARDLAEPSDACRRIGERRQGDGEQAGDGGEQGGRGAGRFSRHRIFLSYTIADRPWVGPGDPSPLAPSQAIAVTSTVTTPRSFHVSLWSASGRRCVEPAA